MADDERRGDQRSADEIEQDVVAERDALVVDIQRLKGAVHKRLSLRRQLRDLQDQLKVPTSALRTHMREHPDAWRAALALSAVLATLLITRKAASRR